jgi:hypothetical protein
MRVFQFVPATPESPERSESVSELSPDCLFDGVVAAADRGAQALLSEQGDASEPRSVVGQDVGAVGVTGDPPGPCGAVFCANHQAGKRPFSHQLPAESWHLVTWRGADHTMASPVVVDRATALPALPRYERLQ